jgi:hypothetical protein
MFNKQQEYDDKITTLKEQLENKKNDILEKNKLILETDKQISTAEEGLKVLKNKLQHYAKKGGKKIQNVITKVKKNNSIKIMEKNTNLLLQIKNILGGQSKSIPEKLNKNLNKLLDENSNLKNKKNVSQIVNDITPIILQYQQNIDKYHDTLVNRDTLKKSLQEAFIKLRNFEQAFSDTKYKLADQGNSIKEKIEKIQTIIEQMENDQKPQDLIDKIKKHKLQLIDFLNTRGNYIQKVEQLNDTLVQRRNSLNTSKNDVRNKLNELQTIGANLDKIKEELESHTDMYGGNILNKAILKSKVKKDDYLRYLTNPIEYIIKGGNAKISKLQNQWKQDQSDYIFNNFEFNDLKTIATKWGISNLNKFKNKKDLGTALKLILYIKTGLNKNFQSLVLASYFLDIDISDVDKHDIGEIIKRINKKTINIPFNSNIQTGGAFISDDVNRFVEKNSAHSVSPKIIIHIPSSFEDFITNIKKNSDANLNFIAQKLTGNDQLGQSVTKMKNGIYDSSYNAKILKLEDITNPKLFAQLSNMKKWWIQGKYLNKSPFNITKTLYPETQYIEHDEANFIDFVTKAIHSSDSIVAIKDILESPDFIDTKQDFNKLLQQHVNQLINLNSTHLSAYVGRLHDNDYKNIRVFKPTEIKIIKDLFKKNPTTKELPAFLSNMEKYLISPSTNGPPNTNYQMHTQKNLPKIIVQEVFPDGDENDKRDEGLITGQIIGYKLDKTNPLDLRYLQFIVYNQFYKSPKPNKKYHNQDREPETKYLHTIKNVFRKDIKFLSMTIDQTDPTLQSGGHGRTLQIIKDTQDPGIIDSISEHEQHPLGEPDIPKSKFAYLERDPKSEELMNNAELENHINRIGNLLLDIKKNVTPFEQKTKVGIFNIIGDSDESNVIDRNTLLVYLTTIETWLENYKPTELQVIELYEIINYIKKFYKGNDFDAVIKSQKMQLLENLNDLKNLNESGDKNKKIEKFTSRIDTFVEDFQTALQEYDRQFLADYVDTTNLSEFITQEEKKTKGYLFEQHAKKLRKIFCVQKESDSKQCEINNKAFPVNNEGKKQIENFIRFVDFCANRAKEIENDIILVETIINQLNQLHTIFENVDIKDIAENKDKDSVLAKAKEIQFPKLKQQLLNRRDYDTKKYLDPTKIVDMIDKLKGGGDSVLLNPTHALPSTHALLNPTQTSTHALLNPIVRNEFVKLINDALQNFGTLNKELLSLYSKIGSNTSKDDINNDDINIINFIEEYLEDLGKHVKTYYIVKKQSEGPKDELTEKKNKLREIWDILIEQINLKQKRKVQVISLKNIGNTFLKNIGNTLSTLTGRTGGKIGGKFQQDIQPLPTTKLLQQISHFGGGKTEDIQNIINGLTSSIQSSYRKEFFNIKKSSMQNAVIDSTVNDRFSQLKQLAKLRRSVSKEIADDSTKSEDTQGILKQLKVLDELIRENYVIDNEYKISENVYNLIDENNPDLKLPEYYLISHLQFTIMVGFVNKFEKMWKSDQSFHGKYETYINKLLNGSIFEEENKSKHFDIGNITDDKFLKAYYSDLTKYIDTNNINSFENFLHQTYTKIFSSSESPNDGYDEFWGKTMYDIGIEWEDLRESPDYNGLLPSIDLFGSEANVLSSFEKGLLFSFIIHAKDLINEESEEIITLNPRQKLNKFIKFLPRDTLSYIIVTLDSLSNQNQTGGGLWSSEIAHVDGKHEIPGRFYFHKNLDNIKHLYIFQHMDMTGKKIDCDINPLYPKDEKLIKKLQIPLKDFNKVRIWKNQYNKIDNKNFKNTVGLVQDGSYESILLPNKSQRQKKIKECAEYRITNTGKKFKGFSIWEFEKKDFKDDFIPLILWPEKELNKLEKNIISIGEGKQEDFQKKKYSALITLIEKGDFGTYITEKNKLTFTLEFDKLTKKTTEKFWENNFPEFSKIDKTKIKFRGEIQQIIRKMISFLRKKEQSVQSVKNYLGLLDKEVFTIDYIKKPIPLSGVHKIKHYKKYIDEINLWIDNIKKLVEFHEKL